MVTTNFSGLGSSHQDGRGTVKGSNYYRQQPGERKRPCSGLVKIVAELRQDANASILHRFFFCSCAALIMTMVTVLDQWRPCASNATLQKQGGIPEKKQANKNRPNNEHTKQNKHKTGSPPQKWNGETTVDGRNPAPALRDITWTD